MLHGFSYHPLYKLSSFAQQILMKNCFFQKKKHDLFLKEIVLYQLLWFSLFQALTMP